MRLQGTGRWRQGGHTAVAGAGWIGPPDRVRSVSFPRWPVVVFDLDGTLVNTIPLIVESYQHALRTVLGSQLDEVTIRSFIGRTLVSTFTDVAPERVNELVEVYVEHNLSAMPRLLQRYAGMETLLPDLTAAGLSVGIATSKRRSSAELSLQCAGLGGLVDLVSTMDDTTAHKPSPEPILHALAAMQAEAREAVYVGDAVVDVLAAQAAGTASVAVTWGAGTLADLRAANPDAIVSSPDELRGLLLGDDAG